MMYSSMVFLGIYFALQIGRQAVCARGLKLGDVETVRRWQISSKSQHNIRTGRKFKDLDKIFEHQGKRSSHWGSTPTLKFRELDLEDDPEQEILDHNYKAFLEDDNSIEEEPRLIKGKRTIRSVDISNDLGASKELQSKTLTTQINTDRLKRMISNNKKVQESSTTSLGLQRPAKMVSNELPFFSRKRRLVSPADDAIRSARAAIAKLEHARDLNPGRKETIKSGAGKRDQMQVLSLNGVNPVQSQIISEEDLKDKQLWNSRQEALRLLQGAGVNLDDANKQKIDAALKFNEQPKTPSLVKAVNGVHNQIQNRVQAETASPIKEANITPKLTHPQQSAPPQISNNVKNQAAKTPKIKNQVDVKNLRPGQGHVQRNGKDRPAPDTKGSAAQMLKLDKDNSNGELIQRTKIESPELSRKEKMRIVPSNVARAVAMAMEQLRRDKMWGKVFVHVLPSGKLKVMVQETKKMEDD